MSIELVTTALGKLADTKAKIVLLLRNQSVLARQTDRIAGFTRQHPEIRVDWLAYGTGIKELDNRIGKILENEAGLRTDLTAWVDRNFSPGSTQAVKIDLEALGIRNLSGEIPLEPFLNLGDGSITSLASGIFGLQSDVAAALGLIETLQKSHAETLTKVRQLVAAGGKAETLKDLDGVIAANDADKITGMGTDPSTLILAGLALWVSWKVYRWFSDRGEAA